MGREEAVSSVVEMRRGVESSYCELGVGGAGRRPRSAGEECRKVMRRERERKEGERRREKEIETDRWNYSTDITHIGGGHRDQKDNRDLWTMAL